MPNPSILTRENHRTAARRRVARVSIDSAESRPRTGPGWAGSSPRKERRQKPPAELEPALPLPICKGCGVALEREPDRLRRRGTYCPECFKARRIELGSQLPRLSGRLTSSLGTRSRTIPHDRGTQPPTSANITQRRLQAEWDATHPDANRDRGWFKREVLPKLSRVSITQIMQATDIATSSASKVRSGQRVPHPRH